MYIEGDVTVRALNIILMNVLAGCSASREPAREKFFYLSRTGSVLLSGYLVRRV